MMHIRFSSMSSSTSLAFADEPATSVFASSGLADDFSFDWAGDFVVLSDSLLDEASGLLVPFSGLEGAFFVSSYLASVGGRFVFVLSSFVLEVDGSTFNRSVLVGEPILSSVPFLAGDLSGFGELRFTSSSKIEGKLYYEKMK